MRRLKVKLNCEEQAGSEQHLYYDLRVEKTVWTTVTVVQPQETRRQTQAAVEGHSGNCVARDQE